MSNISDEKSQKSSTTMSVASSTNESEIQSEVQSEMQSDDGGDYIHNHTEEYIETLEGMDQQFQILIPSHLIGLLIGHSGNNIKYIANQNTTRVKVLGDNNTGRFYPSNYNHNNNKSMRKVVSIRTRKSTLYHCIQSIASTIASILKILKLTFVEFVVDYPTALHLEKYCKMYLFHTTSCNLQIMTTYNVDDSRIISVTGDVDNIPNAMHTILSILFDPTRLSIEVVPQMPQIPQMPQMPHPIQFPFQPMMQIEPIIESYMAIHYSLAGHIMGLNGTTIQKIREQTHCRLHMTHPHVTDGNGYRFLKFIGLQSCVYAAMEAITSLIDNSLLSENITIEEEEEEEETQVQPIQTIQQ
jgi:hypothetical protein